MIIAEDVEVHSYKGILDCDLVKIKVGKQLSYLPVKLAEDLATKIEQQIQDIRKESKKP